MNALAVPFVCAVALATMAGAGVHHWLAVRDQIAGRAPLKVPVEEASTETLPAPPAVSPVGSPETAAVPQAIDPDLAARLDRVIAGQEAIMQRFAEIDRQNLDLRDQVAETNRDLMELQFRVDSHSESFRPLRAIQANATVPENSLLPPRE